MLLTSFSVEENVVSQASIFNVTLAVGARSFSAYGVPPVSARPDRHLLYATSIYGSDPSAMGQAFHPSHHIGGPSPVNRCLALSRVDTHIHILPTSFHLIVIT